ncbi:MAG: hypothetical protein QM533_07015 [Cytophagales bacterium]|nr:hypothetical protein [Cytophagales bacterium]
MQGQLFTQDFLIRGVLETPSFEAALAQDFANFETKLRDIYAAAGVTVSSTINEAQTESEIIYKVLVALGWGDDFLPQVNLSNKRREDVPDCLLFANSDKKTLALAQAKDDRRYRHGIAVLEAKRWLRPLDRGDASEAYDPDAPSSQMLRYLSRADAVSERAVKWGVLTNGNVWRLYWQDARSRSEDFFEVDVAAALGVQGIQHERDEIEPAHTLKLFYLFFQKQAFLPQEWDSAGRTFHAYALNEARLYEEKVSQDLGARVFDDIFPKLADALARGDQEAKDPKAMQTVGYGQFTRKQFTSEYLDEVREAALVLLYRLLFLFYAEDRNLLPVRDERYAEYSVRRIREGVRSKVDAGATFSSTMAHIWLSLQSVTQLIDEGDDEIGMPAYNGGLFSRSRSALLNRAKVPDKVMAPIIDALSRRTEDLSRGWINYRDLAVAHLGGIYERLLEFNLVHEVQAKDDYKDLPEINRIVAAPSSFARKVSGSYYTHDDLVRLILRESVGQLAQTRWDAFDVHLKKLSKKTSLNPGDWDALDAIDPAQQILGLKICDPAMGSGHFLVALVDDMADRVLEAVASAALQVAAQPWAAHLAEAGRPWQSPVLQRIAAIRQSIKTTAKAHGWTVTDAQLDDRHIVRRMILKKCIFGVDKNAMAVELAKTALWLHTFTVGAPLSFLDHHLQVGDSLHGEQLPNVQKDIQKLGALLLQTEFERLGKAAANIDQVADLTDVDIAEVRLSKELALEAKEQAAPILAVMDFWRALRWLIPGWPVNKISQLPKLLKAGTDAQGNQQPHPMLSGLVKLLDPNQNLVATLYAGKLEGRDAATLAANDLMDKAAALAATETFFHWGIQFPTVFGGGDKPKLGGGFDAVIGNPPWDRIKLQEVEWFSERSPAIAAQARAADRKRMIAALQNVNMKQMASNTPPLLDLWAQFQQATTRAEANARVLGNGKLGSGDYPLLGGGDVNLYSLFVERAQSLINAQGIVALITPSGIAADKGAAAFFKSISSTGKLHALFDFENRKVFFPDVDSRFKFCALVFGKTPRMTMDEPPQALPSRCAFYLHSLDELDHNPKRTLLLSSQDFDRVNPNTGAAPIFRNRRDADITLKLYAQHPVLVQRGTSSKARGQEADIKVWPVKYATMFHMTNDSQLFLKADELKKQAYKKAPLNRWVDKNGNEAVPLYEGKMVQAFDHRAADVVVNEGNLMRPAQQEAIEPSEKANVARFPVPQYWVAGEQVLPTWDGEWCIAYKSVTAPSNMRTMIAAIVPKCGVGNSMAMLLPEANSHEAYVQTAPLLLANLNSMVFDFALRQKVQGQNLNWFIVEQATVIQAAAFDKPLPRKFVKAMRQAKLMNGYHDDPTVADCVIPQVLALTYTAHDMAAFAKDLGYVDKSGNVLAPFVWDEAERRARMAALDAVFFYLYGLDANDAAYIMDSFPIVREQDTKAFGQYQTRVDVLAWLQLLQS